MKLAFGLLVSAFLALPAPIRAGSVFLRQPRAHDAAEAGMVPLAAARDRRSFLPVAPNSGCVSPAPIALTLGLPYNGDTSATGNEFDTNVDPEDSYPGLLTAAGWVEDGPDVVHSVTLTAVSDLRIHLDVTTSSSANLDVILVGGGGPCNTANWQLAGDDTIILPDAPAGDYWIIVDGRTSTDAAPYTLTVAGARNVLLVDDDGSGDASQCLPGTCPNVRTAYTNALNAIVPAVTYSIHDVATSGLVAPQVINNYKSVIWFTGKSWENISGTSKTITPADEDRLKDYLRLGGRLMLIGQDLLFGVTNGVDGRIPDGSLFTDFLLVNEVYHDVWDASAAAFTVDGVMGNPISDALNCNDAAYLFDQVRTVTGAPFVSYVDSLVTRLGEPVFYNNYVAGNTKSQKPVAVRTNPVLAMAAPTGDIVGVDREKSLFAAFAPECDLPANVLADMTNLFSTTLTYFDQDDSWVCYYLFRVDAAFDDSVLGNNNGIPDPGETFDFTVTVQNDDSVAHNVKLYSGFEDYYATRFNDGTDPPYDFCKDLGSIPAAGSASASFRITMLAGAPLGYDFRPEINIIDATTGESFCFHQGFGIFVGQPDVLLVKDEIMAPNTTGVDTYVSLLSTLGMTPAVWETDRYGPPTYNTYGNSNDFMRNYDFVIWFTGLDSFGTLTMFPWEQFDPEVELSTYLNNRFTDTGDAARLVISSQDYLYDRYAGVTGAIPAPDFASAKLKVNYVQQDFLKDATSYLYGINRVYSSDRINFGFNMGLQNGQVFTNYADRIGIDTAEAGTEGLWSFSESQPQNFLAGVGNLTKGRASKFAFFPFAFENLQDGTPGLFPSKKRFLERLLCQMKMTGASLYPPCGYYLPKTLGPETASLRVEGGTNTVLTWDAYSFVNDTPGADPDEPISGSYRIRRASCSTLTTGPFNLPVIATSISASWNEPSAPPAGTAWCYNVIDYEDVFGTAANLNGP